MKEKIYEQISSELKTATQLDAKIMITSVVVTLILFFLALGFASATVTPSSGSLSSLIGGGGSSYNYTFNTTPTVIMFVLVIAILAIAWYAVKALNNNKRERARLNEGLMKLYKDEGVDGYYDGSIFKGYETRYGIFTVMVGVIGAVGIIVPLAVFIDQLTKL